MIYYPGYQSFSKPHSAFNLIKLAYGDAFVRAALLILLSTFIPR